MRISRKRDWTGLKEYEWTSYKLGNFFSINQTIEEYFFFIFQLILESSDLTNTGYIEQKFSVSSEFVKMRVHYILLAGKGI